MDGGGSQIMRRDIELEVDLFYTRCRLNVYMNLGIKLPVIDRLLCRDHQSSLRSLKGGSKL